MIRVLQSVNNMHRAGLETMLMNYYRHMDKNVIQFDFLTHRPQRDAYDDEIESMGGRVFHAPRLYIRNLRKYYRYMKELFIEHPEYKILHSHIDAMSFFPLLAGKKNNIPIRIAHSHTSKLDRDFKLPIKFFALKNIRKVCNRNFACGKLAGEFMFGDMPFQIVKNAIDIDKFGFDENDREQLRRKFGLEDKFVLGHVGRFCYIKNQLYLIDVFKEVLKERSNAILLLIGKGEDQQLIEDKIKKLKLEDKVLLMIDRSDVEDLYQVMDIFVMPSLFEGLPLVAVEAQANGLPCLVSDTISEEVMLTSQIERMSLQDGISAWAKKILSVDLARNANAKNELREMGYDIKIEAKKLQEWYVSAMNDLKND